MEHPLRKLFEMFQQGENENFEPLAPLSKKEADEWEKLNNETAKIQTLKKENEAKRQLFWSKIEKKTGIYDRTLRIDNGMVLIQKDEKSNCKAKGSGGIPGFCNGDCENCAMGKEEP
jgi:hypothetical protein